MARTRGMRHRSRSHAHLALGFCLFLPKMQLFGDQENNIHCRQPRRVRSSAGGPSRCPRPVSSFRSRRFPAVSMPMPHRPPTTGQHFTATVNALDRYTEAANAFHPIHAPPLNGYVVAQPPPRRHSSPVSIAYAPIDKLFAPPHLRLPPAVAGGGRRRASRCPRRNIAIPRGASSPCRAAAGAGPARSRSFASRFSGKNYPGHADQVSRKDYQDPVPLLAFADANLKLVLMNSGAFDVDPLSNDETDPCSYQRAEFAPKKF